MKKSYSQLICLLMVFMMLFVNTACKAGQKLPFGDEELNPQTEESTTVVQAKDDQEDSEETEAEAKDDKEDTKETEAEAKDDKEDTKETEAEAKEDKEDSKETEAEAKDDKEDTKETKAEAKDDKEDTKETKAEAKDDKKDKPDLKAGLQKLPALSGNEAALFMLEQGFKVYDITKMEPLAVNQAIFGANYDPKSLTLGLKYLNESGIFSSLDKKANFGTGLNLDFGPIFNQVPLDLVFRYLSRLEINLYNVFYLSFPDAEAAEEAFYTGNGIIELNEDQKDFVKDNLKLVDELVDEHADELTAEVQKHVKKFMEEKPEQAKEAIAMLQNIVQSISTPEWVTKDKGRLVRKISLDLPFGTVFIEEAQHDNHLILIFAVITTDDESQVHELNEGLHIYDKTPEMLISLD